MELDQLGELETPQVDEHNNTLGKSEQNGGGP
jgi:hypothetical protein